MRKYREYHCVTALEWMPEGRKKTRSTQNNVEEGD